MFGEFHRKRLVPHEITPRFTIPKTKKMSKNSSLKCSKQPIGWRGWT